jgi:glycosyltransferase involved in cell wall biosynthesis
MPRIRVAFLIRDLTNGGAQRQLVALAKGLDKRRFDVSVICYYPGGSLEQDLSAAGVPVTHLGKRSRWDVLRFLLRLRKALRRPRPHILHGYLTTSNIISVLFRPFLPNTRIVWGVRASNMDLTRYDRFSRLTFRIECLCSRFADRVIVNSQAGRDYHLAHGFPRRRITVIPNGIDAETFRPDMAARRDVRSQWNLDPNENVIGLVARLDPVKDHPTFLRAASLLARQKEQVKFVCVGGGPEAYQRRLLALADKLRLGDRVIWEGDRTDMPAVYSAFDIFSLSSSSEGFSNVICEAMACGVPCVVTDAGDSAVIVGGTGIVVPAGDPPALAQGWREVLDRIGRERAELAQNARRRIQAEFNIARLVDRTSAALVDML